MRIQTILTTLALALTMKQAVRAQEVRVAAAADLQFTMPVLVAQFEKQCGTKVAVTYGSSGNFFSQLENGAPFDLFFSADVNYPKKLEAAGLTVPGSLYVYALGRIVIWTPADTKVDVTKRGWDALLASSVQKIAIANPEHAPYGAAAVAALKSAGVYERVKSKIVFGENVSQAAQFVQTGNAQAGILAKSLLLSPAMQNGKYWEIPASQYPAIEQSVVVLKASANVENAAAFLEYVKGPNGQRILNEHGFGLMGSGVLGAVTK